MHVIFTSSDQAILHFSPLEVWNYSKELWVNEVWHNPHLVRRLYTSIYFLLGIEKDVIAQDKFSRYFSIHCKNSPQIDVRSTASLDYIINIAHSQEPIWVMGSCHSTLCSDSSAGKFEIGFVARFVGIEAKRRQNNWHLEVLEHELRLITNRTGDSVN